MNIKNHFSTHQKIVNSFINNEENFKMINDAVEIIIKSMNLGGKVFSCGNGGSMCDAMHFSQELSGYFNKKRRPLPSICISDPSYITCVSNDTKFDYIYSRYLEANASKNDVLLAISTSGKSVNIINAAKEAKNKNMNVIALTSSNKSDLLNHSDVSICVDTTVTERGQELHILIIHSIVSSIEQKLNL